MLLLAAVAIAAMAGRLDAQTFYQVSPTGSFYRTSSETPSAPLIISLADYLGATSLSIKPRGQLQVAGRSSPVHDAVFCAVFSSSNTLLGSSLQQRVPGAIATDATTESPCATGNTFYGGVPTNIAEDFFIPFAGLDVTIPTGAQYLFVSVPDDYYSDNVSPNASQYGVMVTATVPEPSSLLLLTSALVAFAAARYRRPSNSR
jgi:hypothetical protein